MLGCMGWWKNGRRETVKYSHWVALSLSGHFHVKGSKCYYQLPVNVRSGMDSLGRMGWMESFYREEITSVGLCEPTQKDIFFSECIRKVWETITGKEVVFLVAIWIDCWIKRMKIDREIGRRLQKSCQKTSHGDWDQECKTCMVSLC